MKQILNDVIAAVKKVAGGASAAPQARGARLGLEALGERVVPAHIPLMGQTFHLAQGTLSVVSQNNVNDNFTGIYHDFKTGGYYQVSGMISDGNPATAGLVAPGTDWMFFSGSSLFSGVKFVGLVSGIGYGHDKMWGTTTEWSSLFTSQTYQDFGQDFILW
jgi:hypothetical protein